MRWLKRKRGRNNAAAPEEHETGTNPSKNAGYESRHEVSPKHYYICAIALLFVLTFIGFHAPSLPSVAFIIVFAIYAIPATCGSLYYVMVKRLHKQYKYKETGNLSRLNRRWTIQLAIMLVLSLVSAFLFTLSAPGWDQTEWMLIWAAGLLYWPLYRLVKRPCADEYREQFYKATALKCSAVIMAIVLCVAYAVIGTMPLEASQIDFSVALQNRSTPFGHSTCALLCEVDKLSTYSDCLARYGIGRIVGTSYCAAFVARIVFSATVFFGITSQLNTCLLTFSEIKSEFKLLPGTPGEDDAQAETQRRPFYKPYFVVALVIFVVASAVFLGGEYELSKAKASNSYAFVDNLLDETTSWIVLTADYEVDELQAFVEHGEEEQALEQEFRARSTAFIEENEGALKESIDAYYQSCIDNVDAYLGWYYSAPTNFAKFFKAVQEKDVVTNFEEGVIEPVDRTSVVDSYANYVGGLKSIYSEYCLEKAANDTDAAFQVPTAEERFSGVSDYPTLWPMWESDARAIVISSVLADVNSDADEDATKAKIVGYIESERDTLLALVDYATSRLQ